MLVMHTGSRAIAWTTLATSCATWMTLTWSALACQRIATARQKCKMRSEGGCMRVRMCMLLVLSGAYARFAAGVLVGLLDVGVQASRCAHRGWCVYVRICVCVCVRVRVTLHVCMWAQTVCGRTEWLACSRPREAGRVTNRNSRLSSAYLRRPCGFLGQPPSADKLRWPDSRESIRRFARIAWFSRIVSGFPSWTPFLRIALQGANNCESQLWGNSRESLARYEDRFARSDSRESPRFALRIAGPSKLTRPNSKKEQELNLETKRNTGLFFVERRAGNYILHRKWLAKCSGVITDNSRAAVESRIDDWDNPMPTFSSSQSVAVKTLLVNKQGQPNSGQPETPCQPYTAATIVCHKAWHPLGLTEKSFAPLLLVGWSADTKGHLFLEQTQPGQNGYMLRWL